MRSLAISASRWSRRQSPHPDQVVRGGREDEDPIHPSNAAVPQLAEQADRFHPPEHLFDPFADPLTHRVTGMAFRAAINRAELPLGAHVRRGARRSSGVDKRPLIKALVAPDGLRAGRQRRLRRDRDLALRGPAVAPGRAPARAGSDDGMLRQFASGRRTKPASSTAYPRMSAVNAPISPLTQHLGAAMNAAKEGA